MKYYKVKSEYDNKRRNDDNIYIANELYKKKKSKNIMSIKIIVI